MRERAHGAHHALAQLALLQQRARRRRRGGRLARRQRGGVRWAPPEGGGVSPRRHGPHRIPCARPIRAAELEAEAFEPASQPFTLVLTRRAGGERFRPHHDIRPPTRRELIAHRLAQRVHARARVTITPRPATDSRHQHGAHRAA